MTGKKRHPRNKKIPSQGFEPSTPAPGIEHSTTRLYCLAKLDHSRFSLRKRKFGFGMFVRYWVGLRCSRFWVVLRCPFSQQKSPPLGWSCVSPLCMAVACRGSCRDSSSCLGIFGNVFARGWAGIRLLVYFYRADLPPWAFSSLRFFLGAGSKVPKVPKRFGPFVCGGFSPGLGQKSQRSQRCKNIEKEFDSL